MHTIELYWTLLTDTDIRRHNSNEKNVYRFSIYKCERTYVEQKTGHIQVVPGTCPCAGRRATHRDDGSRVHQHHRLSDERDQGSEDLHRTR